MRALVLCSTQTKHPAGSASWARATLAAVDTLAAEGHEIVASVGTLAWELGLWKAASCGARVLLVCPLGPSESEQDRARRATADFGLQPDRTGFRFLRAERGSRRLKQVWAERDVLAFDLADLVAPVSIRPGGRLAALLEAKAGATRVDERFRVAFERPRPLVGWDRRRPGSWPSLDPGEPRLLLHFTRASDGPWPGERARDFYSELCATPGRYARDAFATLRRIVLERRLRASDFRIRAGGRAVSFTGLAARDALGMVRWRRRYARWGVEPYAVGIRVAAARAAGIEPVAYDGGARGAERDSSADSFSDSALRQGRGDDGAWEAEREWRAVDDVDLARFDPSDVVVFTATDREASELSRECPFRVVAFGFV